MAEHGLSEDEVADLKEAFNMFDVDGGGTFYVLCLCRIDVARSPTTEGGWSMCQDSIFSPLRCLLTLILDRAHRAYAAQMLRHLHYVVIVWPNHDRFSSTCYNTC